MIAAHNSACEKERSGVLRFNAAHITEAGSVLSGVNTKRDTWKRKKGVAPLARLTGRVLDLLQDRDAPARNHDSQTCTKGEMGAGAAHMRCTNPNQTELRRRRCYTAYTPPIELMMVTYELYRMAQQREKTTSVVWKI
ncbi:hypothetical protein FCM35_KLT09731 [Carex littledalei]|uniref:Uncharacterized protein n=1 Tax=Carex littledalei TaxID=544730 RepID=A0A833VHQ0_9POAL|nr:hypothetical protein FCM35_KLT09731 [Carex littledalei]